MSLFLDIVSSIGTASRGASEAMLMTKARAEPNAMVRQQKIQMVLQLRTIDNSFLRNQMVNEIIKQS